MAGNTNKNIVISKFIKHDLKAKCRALYSRALLSYVGLGKKINKTDYYCIYHSISTNVEYISKQFC